MCTMAATCVATPAKLICLQIFNEVVSPKDKGIFGWFDAWRTRWQMLQAVNLRRAGRHAEADALQRELDQKVRCLSPALANRRLRL